MRLTLKTAAVAMISLAACGMPQDQQKEDLGDVRGVEEIGSALTALAPADISFNSTTGKVTITLQASETLVIVSKRASDSALLINGFPQLDTTKVNLAIVSGTGAGLVKAIAVNAAAANTTVVLDYYNGTFVPGIAPVSPATFGTAGTVVSFAGFAGGQFKVRGSSGNDTFYAGQDTHASNPNVLISFSGTNPDIEVTSSGTAPSLGFSLGLGNDVFDATAHKGNTVGTLASAVTVHGGGGNDTIIGGSGADTLYGDEGLNVIDESTGSVASHTADSVYGLTTATTLSGTNSTTVTYANWANVTTGVTVKIAHLATALLSGVTDNIDDTVGVVIGSPLADTMQCSLLTDVPCVLEGGAGDDTLSPGLSVTNTAYLFGGDGNDTFAMNTIGNHVGIVGGNISDIATTKNTYSDTVDYSAVFNAGAAPANTTISMNGTGPATCNVATSLTIPPCPGVADATPSGIVGAVHTDIRNDVTVAKCPTGSHSAGVACTVKANASGDTIYSGWGSDALTGGTGDDVFVIADFTTAVNYVAATASKVITGGGGNDTADFSHHTSGVVVHLNCALATCANSGSADGLIAADHTVATDAPIKAAASAAGVVTLNADYAAITAPTAHDTSAKNAAVAVNTAAQTLETALTAAVAGFSAGTVTAVTTATTALTTALATLAAVTYTAGTDSATVNADGIAIATAATAVKSAATAFSATAAHVTTLNTDYAAAVTGTTNTAVDDAEDVAALAANLAAQSMSAALTAAVANPNATNIAAVATALTALTTANATLATANAAYAIGTDDASVNADAIAIHTDVAAVGTTAAAFGVVSEGISLVNVNNTVCPAGGTQSCAVTSNGNADLIDFNGDGAVVGSSLACNSSSVVTVNASGLTPNCGL